MGAVKIDTSKQDRALEQQYALDRFEGIYALLNNLHQIREMRFQRGDYDSCILLLDFEDAVSKANLTIRQQQVLFLAFEMDFKQEEIATMLGISQQAVSDHVNNAIKKIAFTQFDKELI